jgi:hypothetical protein
VWTIRSRLLKVGCIVTESVRRVRVALSSSHPLQDIWRQAIRLINAKAELVF